jgi:hypothetical protein
MYQKDVHNDYQGLQKQMDEIKNSKVDPTRFWNQPGSTMALIGLAIAAGAQGFAQGMTGRQVGTNWGEMIINLADRDINMQRQEIAQKRENLSSAAQMFNVKRSMYDDDRSAILAQRATMLQGMDQHLKELQVGTQNVEAQNQLETMRYQNKLSILKTEFEFATHRAQLDIMREGQRLDFAAKMGAKKKDEPLAPVELLKSVTASSWAASQTKDIEKMVSDIGVVRGIAGSNTPMMETDAKRAEVKINFFFAKMLKDMFGGNASDQDYQRLISLKPKWTETPDMRSAKMQEIRDIITQRGRVDAEAIKTYGSEEVYNRLINQNPELSPGSDILKAAEKPLGIKY